MIKVKNIQDIQEGIKIAKYAGKTISIGGRRHSMGGQTFSKDAIFLDMLSFNYVNYNSNTQTVTVQAGATWKKVQEILAMHSRSIKVMQSDNIFTVGGFDRGECPWMASRRTTNWINDTKNDSYNL